MNPYRNQKVINSDGVRMDSRFNLREAEIDMRVPVDPYTNGQASKGSSSINGTGMRVHR